MKISKTLKIDDIYEKVKDYDLVLTVEAPLADALNNRIRKPKLGEFAVTPKRLIYGKYKNEKIGDERELFLEIVRKSDIPWKNAFYLLENVLSCWKNTGDLHKVLEYEDFDGRETRKIIEIIEETKNVYSAMSNFEPEKDKSTAVVAPYQFTELDKEVIPEKSEHIDVFEEEKRKIPEFKVFGTVDEVLRSIQKNVTRENAEDVGILVSPDSQYPPLLQSVFRSENVPLMLGRDFAENESLRNFLIILNLGLSERGLQVRDVQPVLRHLGTKVSIEHNKKSLEDLEIDELEKLKDLLSNVGESSFAEILDRYERMSDGNLEKVRKRLEELGVLDEKIVEESLNRLEYYLDSFDIRSEGSERGVLMASAKSASFVDRPIVLFLGMDSTWEHSIPEKPWIDRKEFEKRNLKNFELLLQNGERQYFLIRESEMGNDITPCLYFDGILEGEFDTFTDLPHENYSEPKEMEWKGFDKEDYGVEVEEEKMLSQSDLNSLVKCPKEYFFSQVVPMEKNQALEMGSLFHDFTEFYVNNRKFVEEKGLEEFSELILEELEPFTESFMKDIARTRIEIGLENIVEFLEREKPEEPELQEYGKKSWENFFAEYFGKSVSDSVTEAWFENPELGVKGKIDLVKDRNHLVDYKSGRRKSARSIVKRSNVDLFEDNPNFQSILYLTHHRRKRPGEKLKFSFVHFLDNLEDVISGEPDLEENITTVTYYPKPFSEQVAERETFDYLIGDVAASNDRRKTLERMEYKNHKIFFEKADIPYEYDRDKLLGSEMAQEYIDYAQEKVGDYKYVKKGCKSALRKLCRFRKENYFKEDLDRFEEFLKDQLENLNEYKREGFPIGDADLDSLDNRDLILGGEYGTE